jgi:ribosomal protein S18 acetylase RimI-like enzyme
LDRFYGRGIGYGLLKAVEKDVIKNGFKELNLIVYNKNERAIAFYERQGYKSIGIEDFKMEHNTYKILVMTKALD